MVRRLAAFVLALGVTGAPASLTACEILCASRANHESHGDGGGPRHSCHATQPTDTARSLTGGVHVCGHGDSLPEAPGMTVPNTAPGPAVAVMPSALVLHRTGISRVPGPSVTSPPAHSSPRVPLRI